MNFLVLFACFVATAMSQRPSFAGTSPKGVPELHPRFRPNENDNSQPLGSNIGNRLGEVDGSSANLPIDARGDVNLVKRIKTWPEENWPFWFRNYEIIEAQRGRPTGSLSGQSVNNQGFSGSQDATFVSQPSGNSGFQQNSGTGQVLNSRFGEGGNQANINDYNSFSIVINGQRRRYAYNPASDSWVRRQ